jgi:prepilin signal peptidase PulO-like enzyme (type II secretory pathway)
LNHPLRVIPLAVLALAAGLAANEAWAIEPSRFHWALSPAERARLVLLQVVAAAYVFVLGSVLGSFLNVVIYRLPRGMNIVRPRSRCPACATPIRLKDNIPVLGWLVLRGKCRICGGPISPRYPLVEAAVGGVLLLLFWLEVRLGGVNLPNWTPAPLDDLMLFSRRMPWGNFLLAAYHAWLLITLLVMALIQSDGLRVPGIIVRLALAVALLLPLAWPWLRPVPALGHGTPADSAALDGLAGAAAGLLAGALLAFIAPRAGSYPGSRRSLIAAGLLIGAFLGWQAAVSIAALTAAVFLAMHLLALAWPQTPVVPPLAWLALIAWLYVPLWKTFSQMPFLSLIYL